jgi:hypothetical protein
MFRSPHSRTHLFQVTVSKGNVDGRYPMTRGHLYRAAEPARSTAPADRALAG